MEQLGVRQFLPHQVRVAQNGVHGRADVMGHIQQEGGLGLVGLFRRLIGDLQLLAFQLLPLFLGDVSGHIEDVGDLSGFIPPLFDKPGHVPVAVGG